MLNKNDLLLYSFFAQVIYLFCCFCLSFNNMHCVLYSYPFLLYNGKNKMKNISELIYII